MNATSVIRTGLFLVSALLLIAGLTGYVESEYAISLAVVGAFLGATNLGRSCPLILSINYWVKKRAPKQRS